MKKTTITTVIFCLLAVSAAFGQNVIQAIVTPPTLSESSKDLNRQIQQLKVQIGQHRKLLREQTEQLSEQKEAGSKQAKDAREALKKQNEAIKKLEAALAKQQRLADQQATTARRLQKIVIGAVIALVIVILAIMFFVRRNRAKLQQPIVRIIESLAKKLEAPANLIDPEKERIEQWALEHGNPASVPFTLTLPKERISFDCKAERRPGMDPIVHFKGETRTATWKNRRKMAAGLLDAKNRAVSS